jgi:hypothetical protein
MTLRQGYRSFSCIKSRTPSMITYIAYNHHSDTWLSDRSRGFRRMRYVSSVDTNFRQVYETTARLENPHEADTIPRKPWLVHHMVSNRRQIHMVQGSWWPRLVAKARGGRSLDQPHFVVAAHAETFTRFSPFLILGSCAFCMEPQSAGWGMASALPPLQQSRKL